MATSTDEDRQGGTFALETFAEQIAVGGGFGVRLDFGFFVFRVDLGIKMHDPQLEKDERWVIRNIRNNEWIENYQNTFGRPYRFESINLGIGYPF